MGTVLVTSLITQAQYLAPTKKRRGGLFEVTFLASVQLTPSRKAGQRRVAHGIGDRKLGEQVEEPKGDTPSRVTPAGVCLFLGPFPKIRFCYNVP